VFEGQTIDEQLPAKPQSIEKLSMWIHTCGTPRRFVRSKLARLSLPKWEIDLEEEPNADRICAPVALFFIQRTFAMEPKTAEWNERTSEETSVSLGSKTS